MDKRVSGKQRPLNCKNGGATLHFLVTKAKRWKDSILGYFGLWPPTLSVFNTQLNVDKILE